MGTTTLILVYLRGVGIWAIIDLFTMNSKVEDHNQPILEQINKLEKDEKDTEHRRHMEVMAAMSAKANPQS